jgi:chaperonin GroES
MMLRYSAEKGITRYEAIGDQLIVEVLPAEAKSGGGVWLSEAHQDRTGRGIIASVGPRVRDDLLTVGQQVVFAYYHGSEIKHISGPEVLVLHEQDIVAVEF